MKIYAPCGVLSLGAIEIVNPNRKPQRISAWSKANGRKSHYPEAAVGPQGEAKIAVKAIYAGNKRTATGNAGYVGR